MSKFAAICKGTRARRKDVRFTTLHGKEAACDLRVLNGAEHEACLVAASAAAKTAGVPADHGSVVFDFALACEIVAKSAIDPDKQDVEEAYFASVAEVKDGLDRERVFLLFDRQTSLQDEVSPRLSTMTLDEAVSKVFEAALVPEGHELPFELWQPVARRQWVRTLVDLLVSSDALKSLYTSGSSTTSSEPSRTSTPS